MLPEKLARNSPRDDVGWALVQGRPTQSQTPDALGPVGESRAVAAW